MIVEPKQEEVRSPRPVAVVTGASKNIGRSIACALARDGYDLILTAQTSNIHLSETESIAGVLGAKSQLVVGDLRSENEIVEKMGVALSRCPSPRVLVNNAALRNEYDIEDLTLRAWDEVMDITLRGSFLMLKSLLPHLKSHSWGRIVNIAGVSGQVGKRHRAHVVSAKAGLIGLTKALAHDLAPYGITSNAVSPGAIDTASNSEDRVAAAPPNLVGRMGSVDEVAGAVRYLVSESAAYVTGQTINVNGGQYSN